MFLRRRKVSDVGHYFETARDRNRVHASFATFRGSRPVITDFVFLKEYEYTVFVSQRDHNHAKRRGDEEQ